MNITAILGFNYSGKWSRVERENLPATKSLIRHWNEGRSTSSCFLLRLGHGMGTTNGRDCEREDSAANGFNGWLPNAPHREKSGVAPVLPRCLTKLDPVPGGTPDQRVGEPPTTRRAHRRPVAAFIGTQLEGL